MIDLFTLSLVADVAEHCAANLAKTAGNLEDVDARTQAAIAGAFLGFAVVLRAVDTGQIQGDLEKVKPEVMERTLRSARDNTP